MATDDAHTYRDLLDVAYVRGWDDGSFAAPFEPREPGHLTSPVCQGRTPADFARSLWSPRPGEPPAGLELNAPHWYAHGFSAAVALAGILTAAPPPGERTTRSVLPGTPR